MNRRKFIVGSAAVIATPFLLEQPLSFRGVPIVWDDSSAQPVYFLSDEAIFSSVSGSIKWVKLSNPDTWSDS